MADNGLGRPLGWEDDTTVQESEFVLLDPGEYEYTVTSFERGWFDGSAKMAACNVAKLTLHCKDATTGQEGDVLHNLMLNSKVTFRITAFFKSCGLLPVDARQGDRFSMSFFNQVVGRTGRLRLKHRTYNDRTYNDIDEFLKPDAASARQATWGGKGF